MDTKEHRELLRLLRQVVTQLEQVSIRASIGPVCKVCGSNLHCVRCMGSEGGRKQNQMYDKQTKRKWGKKGGRPSKQKLTVDSITGAIVPSTRESTSSAALPEVRIPADLNPTPHELGIDPAKFYRPDEAAPLLGVCLDTMRHWRTAKRGPVFHKLDGHLVRYSGKELLEWLSRSRHSASAEEA